MNNDMNIQPSVCEVRPLLSVVKDDGAPYYIAVHPRVSHVTSHGDTPEEALDNFREVLKLVVSSCAPDARGALLQPNFYVFKVTDQNLFTTLATSGVAMCQ